MMMKNLLLWILLVVPIASFKLSKTSKISKAIEPKNLVTTLNGYSYAQANAMTYFSLGTTDNTPQKTQVLFSSKIVYAWYNILYAERQQMIGLSPHPDGIRIYISRTLPSTESPKHQNNGVIIVSTFAKDTIINGGKTIIHKDYYNHPDTASLFDINPRTGDIKHDKNSDNGASLYKSCHCNTPLCDASDNHEITISEAEKMVQSFRYIPIFRNGSINTQAEWFDFSFLKTLHDDLAKSKDDGIRIYFARGTSKGYTLHKVKFVVTLIKNNVDDFKCYHAFIMPPNKDIGDNGELCQPNCQGVTLPQN